jgi:pimeloyl-ACP methyl ester carboxylesterase
LLRFLEEHGIDNPTLVGHSMGGGIALLLALQLQKCGTPAARLVLIDSIAYPQTFPLFVKLLRIPVVAEIGTRLNPVRWEVRAILRLAYQDDSKITKDAVEAYSAPLRQPGGRHAIIASARRLIPDNLNSIVAQYRDLELPTLIIWGRSDEITPLRVGQLLNEAILGSTLRVLDHLGHVPHEESPTETNEIILPFVRG